MNFIESFQSLGYSAINLMLVWLVFVVVGYRGLRLGQRSWIWRGVFALVMAVLLATSTNFLAEQNKMLNDAIREDGGLKRTKTR